MLFRSPAQALEILKKYNQDAFHLRHGQIVSGVMGWYAAQYDPEQVDYWKTVGMLHDIDFEQYPEEHLRHTEQPLLDAGLSQEEVRAILAHGYTHINDVEPVTNLEKALFTVDELTGIIQAAARMRPAGITDMEVSSFMKKFKDKKFAAKCDREVIKQGCGMLGMEVRDVANICIEAMKARAEELQLGPREA